MIPASYLFRQVYRRKWLEPEAEGRRRPGVRRAFDAMWRWLRPAPPAREKWVQRPAE